MPEATEVSGLDAPGGRAFRSRSERNRKPWQALQAFVTQARVLMAVATLISNTHNWIPAPKSRLLQIVVRDTSDLFFQNRIFESTLQSWRRTRERSSKR